MKIRTTPYDCEAEGHIPGRWEVEDRVTKRRICKICGEVEKIDVRGAPNA